MRLTPEVLPMLHLRSCQLTLLTSLAFGAVLTVFSAPLTAQTTQNSPGVPDLSGYDRETREMIEVACVSHKLLGPAAYRECLNLQVAALQNSSGIPNLSGYDRETREMIEVACVSHKLLGPAAYRECLNLQVAALQNSSGVPDLSGYDRQTRHGDGYSKPARDSLKKLIEKPAGTIVATWKGALVAAVRRCFNFPYNGKDADQFEADIDIQMRPDGTVAAEPVIVAVRGPSRSIGTAMAESAKRAIMQCQAYAFLPKQQYDTWKYIPMTFSMKDMQ
jgi:hypothetical protein